MWIKSFDLLANATEHKFEKVAVFITENQV
jgi:hypothetical protein